MPTPVLASIMPSKAQVSTDTDTGFTLTLRGTGFTANSFVVFGGSVLDTVFLDSNSLSATVLPVHYQNFSLGGLTVYVQNGNEASNNTVFQVSAPSPVKISDLLTITNAISIPSIVNFLETQSPYIEQVPNVEVYRVAQGDTLQGIAQRRMGDTTRWSDIAFINNLRYPFISEDERDLQGVRNYRAVLTRRVNAGDITIFVNGISPFITKDSVLFFAVDNVFSDGTLHTISDVVGVGEVIPDPERPAGTKLRLKTPLLNTYDVGTFVDVLSTNNNTTSRVVTIGDFILIPSPNGSDSFVSSDGVDVLKVYEVLGQDIALDNYGLLSPDGNGDLQTVVGLGNLHQAIAHRLMTELRELDYHPGYGNPLLQYIGHVNTPTLLVLANFEIERVLLGDPRINSIQSIKTTVSGDTLSVRALVNVDLFNKTSELNFVIPLK
jgi:hypothetical protein